MSLNLLYILKISQPQVESSRRARVSRKDQQHIRAHKGQNSTKTQCCGFSSSEKNALESQCRGLVVSVSRCRGVLVPESQSPCLLVLEFRCRGVFVWSPRSRFRFP